MRLGQCIAGFSLLCTFVRGEIIPSLAQRPLLLENEDLAHLQKDFSKELLNLHQSLCEIESITGNEKKVGKWLKTYLESKNFTVKLQEVAKNRYNVFAWPGEQISTPVLVTSHIDTVPPFWPYEHLSNGTIRGRGTVDAKGSVATQITALLSLLATSTIHPSSTSLLYVVGEETSGDGMRRFSESDLNPGNYSSVIFGEPTEHKLVSGHKGIVMFKIHVKGRAAHSGYPWLGVSANEILVAALDAVLKARKDLPRSEKYGETTLNVGHIDGGVAANVVAEEAQAQVAVRIAAGGPADIKRIVTKALEGVKIAAEKEGGRMEVDWPIKGYPPVDMSCDVEGFECFTVNYGTDVPNLKGDHKRYLYGPGSIFVAHSDHEALQVADLEKAVVDYKRLIKAAVDAA